MKKWCLVHWQWCLQFIVQVGILVFLIKGVSVSRLPQVDVGSVQRLPEVYVKSLPMVEVRYMPRVAVDVISLP